MPSDPYYVRGIDTSLNNIESYYQIQGPKWEYFDHGFFGSPHKPIQFISDHNFGYQVGMFGYDRYRYTLNDIRSYYVNRPYSEVRFLIGQDREQIFEGIHTQNIGKRMNFGIHFKREATSGRYQRNRSLISEFDIYGRYISRSGRFNITTKLAYNNIRQQESGGFAVDIFDTDTTFRFPELVPINLDLARHDWKDLEFQLGGEVFFGKTVYITRDSTRIPQVKKQMSAFYNIGAKRYKRAFQDPNSMGSEIDYYGDFYQPLDTIFYKIKSRNLFQEAGFRFFTNPFIRNILLQQRTAIFEVKARHENLEIENFGFEKTYNNLSLEASIFDSRRPTTEGIQYKAAGGFFLTGFNQGDYYFSGEIGYLDNDWGRVKFATAFRSATPTWQQTYYISPSIDWKNTDFEKEGRLTAAVSYSWIAQYLEVGYKYDGISDLVYYDTASLPQQYDQLLNTNSFWIENQIHLGIFHMHNFVSVQLTSNKEINPIPVLQLKSSIYIEGLLFNKALKSRLGVDLRYNTNFNSYRFNPLISQHYLSERNSKFAPVIDVYLNFKIKTVRFLFKLQNATHGLFRKGNYGVYPYTSYERTFTGGFYWRFLD